MDTTGHARSDAKGTRSSYRIAADERSVDRETTRLAALAGSRDRGTVRALEAINVGPGWHCLELGAGSGTVSLWLAEKVMPGGHVLSVDIDLRFHCEPVEGMEVRHLDVVSEELPADAFDLVHARALLQHLEQRNLVIDRMVDATKPGGWVVIEESHWGAFESQPLPSPLARVAAAMHTGLRRREGWDPDVGARLLRMLADRGLVDLDLTGKVGTMRGGQASGNWWFLGIEHAAEGLIEHRLVDRADVDAALEIVRSPDFVMMSPVALTVRGKVPNT